MSRRKPRCNPTSAHANWLRHPVTQCALRAIETHEQSFIDTLVRDATSGLVTDEQVRMNAVGLKTCKAVKALLNNSANFKFTKQELIGIE